MMRYIISLLLTSAALPALAEVPRVVTDLPPVHSLVAQVMGDLGEPVLLLDKGADAHSFQLRPSQAEALSEAGIVVWIGPEMSPWLDRALAGLTEADQLRLFEAEGTHRQGYGGSGGHDHGEDDHSDEGHGHEGLDPHAWLDPVNAGHWLGLIAAELSAQDPDNAAIYSANAAAAQTRVQTLDAEISAILAPHQQQPIGVFHDAYGYFAAHYGLTIAAAIAEGDAAAPGAKHLDEVQTALSAAPTCLFPESNHDPKLATQIAEASGARLGGALDPEGALLEPGPELYGQMMREMAETIAACLNG